MFRSLFKNRVYLLVTLLIIIYLVIVFLLLVKLIDPNGRIIAGDKYIHFIASSLLSFVLYFTLSFQKIVPFLSRYRVVLAIILATFIGTMVEFIQLFIPARSVNILDWIANFLGSVFTVFIIKYIPKGVKKLRKV